MIQLVVAAARVESGRLVVTGAPGRSSQIHISGTIISDAGTMRPGAGCTRLSASRVQCAQVEKIVLYLGNRDDKIFYDAAVPTEQHGGDGDDTLSGNAWPNRMFGLGGNDTCTAGPGDHCAP